MSNSILNQMSMSPHESANHPEFLVHTKKNSKFVQSGNSGEYPSVEFAKKSKSKIS